MPQVCVAPAAWVSVQPRPPVPPRMCLSCARQAFQAHAERLAEADWCQEARLWQRWRGCPPPCPTRPLRILAFTPHMPQYPTCSSSEGRCCRGCTPTRRGALASIERPSAPSTTCSECGLIMSLVQLSAGGMLARATSPSPAAKPPCPSSLVRPPQLSQYARPGAALPPWSHDF